MTWRSPASRPALGPGEGVGTANLPSQRHRLLALRWMLAGFLMSFVGSSLLIGASSGLVSAGILPVAWLAFLATVEMTIDLASPLAVGLLRRFDPGRVLLVVEATDAAACLICLVLLLEIQAPAAPVFIGYMLIISVLPLIIDIAEELFVAEAGRGSPDSVVRFNAVAFSLTAGVALLIARPLGALVSKTSVAALFVVNLTVSVFALVTRWRAVRLSGRLSSPRSGDESLATTAAHGTVHARMLLDSGTAIRDWFVSQERLGVASPLLSGGLGFVTSVYAAYLPIWIAGPGKSRQAILALALAAFGLGRVLGPIVGSRLAGRVGIERSLVWSLVSLIAVLAATWLASLWIPAGASGSPAVVLALACIALLGVGASATLTMLVSARQIRLTGTLLAKTIGLGHAFSAAGAIAGAWTGVALGVQNHPGLGVGVSAAVGALLAGWLLRSRAPQVGVPWGGTADRAD
jgi:hypothetical protein